jgi:transcriptional regulator with XRE-family HTH domain
MSSNPLNHLGEVIAEALSQKGLSQSRAALESGISRETLRRRLRGGDITAAELGSLAYVLDREPRDLVAEAMARAS